MQISADTFSPTPCFVVILCNMILSVLEDEGYYYLPLSSSQSSAAY